jgi:hypothetical protein
VIAAGSVVSAIACTASTASPSATPFFKLKEIVTDGSCRVWFTASGPVWRSVFVVNHDGELVKEISFAPSNAASIGVLPISMCRTMFSSITIASSTTNPTESVSHQRQVVEAVTELVHHGEGGDHRNRQRQARNDRCREVPEEQEDDQDDQGNRQHQRELHVVDRLQGPAIEREEHLAPPHVVAFLEMHRRQLAGDLRTNRDD